MSWDQVVEVVNKKEDKRTKYVKLGAEYIKIRVLDGAPLRYQSGYFPGGNGGKGVGFSNSKKEIVGLAQQINGEAGKKVVGFSDKYLINVLVYDAPVYEDGKNTGKKEDQVMVLSGGSKLFLLLKGFLVDEDYGDLRNYDLKINKTGEKAAVAYGIIPGRHKPLEKDYSDELFDLELVANGDSPTEVELMVAKGMTWKAAWELHKARTTPPSNEEVKAEFQQETNVGAGQISEDDLPFDLI